MKDIKDLRGRIKTVFLKDEFGIRVEAKVEESRNWSVILIEGSGAPFVLYHVCSLFGRENVCAGFLSSLSFAR